jgi:protein-tyrosine phosphatase
LTVKKTRITFVCLGNICRSPLAEGVFKHLVEEAGAEGEFEIESSGVGSWHVGEAADQRAQETARRHGLQLTGVAQQFSPRDFDRFDVIVALDREVAAHLKRMAPNPGAQRKVRLLRESDPERGPSAERYASEDLDVPDPYYGGPKGFESAYQMIERSSRKLLEELRTRNEGAANGL